MTLFLSIFCRAKQAYCEQAAVLFESFFPSLIHDVLLGAATSRNTVQWSESKNAQSLAEKPNVPPASKSPQRILHSGHKEIRELWPVACGESEVSVAEVTDVNRDIRTIRVVEKPYFGFKPKDCEKRNIPISDALLSEIDARAKSASCSLVFGNNGRPDSHLLRRLKHVAFDGSLNCSKCMGTVDGKEVSCAEAPVCGKWILHRFRRNFASDRHNRGASARKIQMWLGHSSLETTLRYLAVGDDTSDEVRSIVNGIHVGL